MWYPLDASLRAKGFHLRVKLQCDEPARQAGSALGSGDRRWVKTRSLTFGVCSIRCRYSDVKERDEPPAVGRQPSAEDKKNIASIYARKCAGHAKKSLATEGTENTEKNISN